MWALYKESFVTEITSVTNNLPSTNRRACSVPRCFGISDLFYLLFKARRTSGSSGRAVMTPERVVKTSPTRKVRGHMWDMGLAFLAPFPLFVGPRTPAGKCQYTKLVCSSPAAGRRRTCIGATRGLGFLLFWGKRNCEERMEFPLRKRNPKSEMGKVHNFYFFFSFTSFLLLTSVI